MMKQILAAACAMTMMLTGAAMAETDVRVTALKGPTAMGMALCTAFTALARALGW